MGVGGGWAGDRDVDGERRERGGGLGAGPDPGAEDRGAEDGAAPPPLLLREQGGPGDGLRVAR